MRRWLGSGSLGDSTGTGGEAEGWTMEEIPSPPRSCLTEALNGSRRPTLSTKRDLLMINISEQFNAQLILIISMRVAIDVSSRWSMLFIFN